MGRDTETGEHTQRKKKKRLIPVEIFFNCQEKEIRVHYVAQL